MVPSAGRPWRSAAASPSRRAPLVARERPHMTATLRLVRAGFRLQPNTACAVYRIALRLAPMSSYDKDKVDEAVLALLCLTMRSNGIETWAWKGHDWDALDRLCQKGYISNPRSKAKSVAITDAGKMKAERLFRKLFAAGAADA